MALVTETEGTEGMGLTQCGFGSFVKNGGCFGLRCFWGLGFTGSNQLGESPGGWQHPTCTTGSSSLTEMASGDAGFGRWSEHI